MAIALAPADHGRVVTRWQARGHAAVHDALGAAHADAKCFEFESADGDTYLDCSTVHVAGLKLQRTHSSGYRCRVEPNGAVRVGLPVRGAVVVASGRGEGVALAGASGLACLDIAHRDVRPDYSSFRFEISVDQLLSSAATLTGRQYQASEIESLIDLRAPVGASLLRTVGTLFCEVEHLSTVGLGQLACASINELVMHLTSAALLPRLREQLALPQRWVGASTAEGARQYIDAHACEPIRLGGLADRFGVSLRALQVGFRKQFGCTLSEYLFGRRLDLARARLLAGSNTMTVTTVALECGFVNVGAFADRYRRAFGELPSQTLKGVTRRSLQRRPDFSDRGQRPQDADRPEYRRS